MRNACGKIFSSNPKAVFFFFYFFLCMWNTHSVIQHNQQIFTVQVLYARYSARHWGTSLNKSDTNLLTSKAHILVDFNYIPKACLKNTFFPVHGVLNFITQEKYGHLTLLSVIECDLLWNLWENRTIIIRQKTVCWNERYPPILGGGLPNNYHPHCFLL